MNLGAGLDARPYRMIWPKSLSWVEIDLPETFDFKERVLAGEQPTSGSTGFGWTWPIGPRASVCSSLSRAVGAKRSSSPRAS